MAILYESVNIQAPKLNRRHISRWIKAVVELYDKKIGTICYVFCNDEEILRINQTYLNHDYYTDIITFDYTENKLLSGDLFISLETVATNAETYQEDGFEELLRVMIHGVLHLCGLKDKSQAEEEIMRNAENQALSMYKQLSHSDIQ